MLRSGLGGGGHTYQSSCARLQNAGDYHITNYPKMASVGANECSFGLNQQLGTCLDRNPAEENRIVWGLCIGGTQF